MAQIGRNAPCPCGSGQKYKRCCLGKGQSRSSTAYTSDDRAQGFALLERHIERPRWAAYVRESFAEVLEGRGAIFELPSLDEYEVNSLGDAILDWIFFETRDERGINPVADLLNHRRGIPTGTARFLGAMSATHIRPLEVVSTRPGQTITFRDLTDDSEIVAGERTASKTVMVGQLIFARIAPGTRGLPELERGLLAVPSTGRAQTLMACEQWRTSRSAQVDRSAELSLTLLDIWIDGTLSRWIPTMTVGDDEEMMFTKSTFDILAPDQISAALDAMPELSATDTARWSWTGAPKMPPAWLRRDAGRLVLETVTVEQDLVKRAALEAALGAKIKHRSTTHQHPAQAIADIGDAPKERPQSGLPRDVERQIIIEHMHRHYFGWLDQGVPALADATPRQAAQDPKRVQTLKGLLRDLDNSYLEGLMTNAVAPFDPSWIWDALGVQRHTHSELNLRLGHEVVADELDGFAAVCQAVAARRRGEPGFNPTTVISSEYLATDIGTRSLFVETAPRILPPDATPADATQWSRLLAQHLGYAVNHALHGRQAFQVDESLSFQLANTDLNVQGAQFHLPSSGMTMVFRDRDMLALMERFLASDSTCTHRGTFLQTLTVYAHNCDVEDGALVRFACVCDAADGRLPYLVTKDLRYSLEDTMQAVLARRFTDMDGLDPVDTHVPLRSALRRVLNTILYVNSAKSDRETRIRPAWVHQDGTASDPLESDPLESEPLEIIFLPSDLDVGTLRGLQHLECSGEGLDLKHRFLTRGHWRKANRNWNDQSPRWIKPQWKGPNVAIVVERLYAQKPEDR